MVTFSCFENTTGAAPALTTTAMRTKRFIGVVFIKTFSLKGEECGKNFISNYHDFGGVRGRLQQGREALPCLLACTESRLPGCLRV
jgi:hypothetical protein